jgi:hypothetical protein
MPNYRFECSEGHEFDGYAPISDWDKQLTRKCEVGDCTLQAQRVFSFGTRSGGLRPFVYFEKPNGEIRVPGAAWIPCPEGMVRKEVTTLAEIRGIEHKLSKDEQSKLSRRREQEDQWNEAQRAGDRSDMRQYIASGQVPEIDYERTQKEGQVVFTGRMKELEGGAREFMMKAIENTNRKRDFRSFDTGTHIGILHNDER